MDSRFADKVVVVTGGGSGIGAAAALRFAAEGATVVVVGRNEKKLASVAARAQTSGNIVTRVVDVSDEVAVTALIEEVAGTYGRLACWSTTRAWRWRAARRTPTHPYGVRS